MKIRSMTCCLATVALLVTAAAVRADVKSKAAQEAAEYVIQRFGRQAVKEGAGPLARKIESYAARYGEEAFLLAVRRAGPETFALVDAAGADGAKAVRVLARHGEEGATWIVKRPKALAQVVRYGDEAAEVLVKHPGIAEPLVERSGGAAVKALAAVNPRNGRRLGMLMEGELGKLPESGKLLDVLAQYGDRAGEFVWNNKGALAVGTALAAFVANPEPFLNGTKEIAKIGGETVAKPLAEGVARGTNWTVVILAVLAAGGVLLAVKLGWLSQLARSRAMLPGRSAGEQGPEPGKPSGGEGDRGAPLPAPPQQGGEAAGKQE
jgi:hypothetical protein